MSSRASASLSSDGKLLAISNLVKGFDVYRMDTGKPIVSFEHVVGKPYAMPVLFIHGDRAIVGGNDLGTVSIWDVALGKLHSLPIPSEASTIPVIVAYWLTPLQMGLLYVRCR